MTITGAVVLFAVLWFLVLFVLLPLGVRTQGEAGRVEPGTPASAPAEAGLAAKLRLATAVAAALWVVIAAVILSGAVGISDLDWTGRRGPPPADGRDG
ncbi:MAG: DUF1467 family protein [Rhodobacteraceae bacterium]|nr:DUF1467 family protein [Paracoccaceae bacterium]